MRIAMIGPFGFHPNKTMRSRALPLAKRLVERGHEVKMFMPPWHTPDLQKTNWQEEGVEIQYTGLGAGHLGKAIQLTRAVIEWEPDLAHAFKPKAYSGMASWWLWHFQRNQIKLVTDADDWEGKGGWNDVADYSAINKRFFNWQERWGLQHCHALTVASRELQNRVLAMGMAEQKIFYLPNGPGITVPAKIEGSMKRAELNLSGRPVVLLYSRLFEFDSRRLVDILAQVKVEVPDLAILTVGVSLFDSDQSDYLEAITSSGMEKAVVEVGWVKEPELPQYIGAADVGIYLMDDNLINRSKCPVKLADMLAVGLPVVAEDVGQVPEYVIQGKTGLLRPSGDVSDIASDLVTLLQDDELRSRLGSGAREHIDQHFSWDRLADIAEEAYDFALQKRN
jgi:glycosyltransferase involved in cell wall biosynthesis